jgi:hypothetical protein
MKNVFIIFIIILLGCNGNEPTKNSENEKPIKIINDSSVVGNKNSNIPEIRVDSIWQSFGYASSGVASSLSIPFYRYYPNGFYGFFFLINKTGSLVGKYYIQNPNQTAENWKMKNNVDQFVGLSLFGPNASYNDLFSTGMKKSEIEKVFQFPVYESHKYSYYRNQHKIAIIEWRSDIAHKITVALIDTTKFKSQISDDYLDSVNSP